MKNIIVIVIIAVAGLIVYTGFNKSAPTPPQGSETQTEEFNPTIDPANFVSVVNNPYYTLAPGTSFTYQGKAKEGTEKIITTVSDKTKKILGVTTIEVWDRVWLDTELIEETYDWYAQDKEGNVWYFGEDSKEYENGKVVSTKGSWEAGVNNAKPGIIMEAKPKIGDSYRQEFYKGEAEDMADVVSLEEAVTVAYGKYSNCLKTRDWSRIDPNLNEYKYYCSKVGSLVLETSVTGTAEKVELISVSK